MIAFTWNFTCQEQQWGERGQVPDSLEVLVMDLVDLVDRSSQVDSDFQLLISEGKLGFYQSCEVTTIFLFDQMDKKARNFYTLVVFEERQAPTSEKCYLTEKMIPVNSRYRLGITRYHLTLEQATERFAELLHHKNWDDELEIGQLQAIPKQFVPKNGTVSVPLNSVLKNNFDNGSYILEFFDSGKAITEQLEEELEELCDHIRGYLPVDLLYIRDRIGNIIFQFPSTLLAWTVRSLQSWEGTSVNVAWHPKLTTIPDVGIQSVSLYDNNIMGFHQVQSGSASIRLNTGNSEDINDIIIFNREDNLILSYSAVSFLKGINLSMHTSMQQQEILPQTP